MKDAVRITISKDDEGWFVATVERADDGGFESTGAHTQARTLKQALERVLEAMALLDVSL